jgi:hypothetical protein
MSLTVADMPPAGAAVAFGPQAANVNAATVTIPNRFRIDFLIFRAPLAHINLRKIIVRHRR